MKTHFTLNESGASKQSGPVGQELVTNGDQVELELAITGESGHAGKKELLAPNRPAHHQLLLGVQLDDTSR